MFKFLPTRIKSLLEMVLLTTVYDLTDIEHVQLQSVCAIREGLLLRVCILLCYCTNK